MVWIESISVCLTASLSFYLSILIYIYIYMLSPWLPRLGNDPDAYRPGGDIHDSLLTSSPSSAVIDNFKEVRNLLCNHLQRLLRANWLIFPSVRLILFFSDTVFFCNKPCRWNTDLHAVETCQIPKQRRTSRLPSTILLNSLRVIWFNYVFL